MSEFGDLSQLAWYPAAYTFAICAITPLAGKMAVVFPLNWVYLSFSVIFLIGSIVCGCAPTSNALYVTSVYVYCPFGCSLDYEVWFNGTKTSVYVRAMFHSSLKLVTYKC